uniref:Uncharacterized protein n=1 Tax=uncultured marine thaumarchaeote KM3_53_E03 TaxID=1456184 RepID=A0A075H9C7_9ARCH|nr:hypothetical protein [uncultured marine thaumarchaeote KM3_53_E03]|tara:strand:- start:167 stop:373 length:207 start_codon:yes stop_codon:yes gene_type:complete
MPTPEEYEQSRNEIRQQIRETLGMRVPESDSKLPSVKKEKQDVSNSIDVQILEELKTIKSLLQKLLDK